MCLCVCLCVCECVCECVCVCVCVCILGGQSVWSVLSLCFSIDQSMWTICLRSVCAGLLHLCVYVVVRLCGQLYLCFMKDERMFPQDDVPLEEYRFLRM